MEQTGKPDNAINERVDRITKRDFPFLVLISLIYSLFVVIWIHIDFERLYHLNAAVLDLGVAAERVWLPLHSNTGFISLLYNIFSGSIIPYMLSPLSYLQGLEPLLIVQAIFIWASVFPIYFISRHFKLNRPVSTIIAISYFLYFPVAGLDYFDFHMMAFFPFLFLLAYAFYVYSYYKVSLILFILTALSKYPFAAFVLIFGFVELISLLFINGKNVMKLKTFWLSLAILLSAAFSLGLGYYLSLLGPNTTATILHTSNGNSSLALGYISITLLLLFGPLLFKPIFNLKWFLLFTPFIGLMIVAHQSVYMFPSLFSDQYSASFVTFIFLGLIDSLSKLIGSGPPIKTRKLVTKQTLLHTSAVTRQVVVIFVLLLLLSLAFQPWSPYVKDNSFMSNQYQLLQGPYTNESTYQTLSNEAKLIPQSNPYVLVPNNIPEAYPRQLINGPYSIGELIMGFPPPVFQNITVSQAVNNSYPYILGNGSIVNIPIDYAWGTVFAPSNYAKSGYQNILQIMNIMLESKHYGILAESNSTLLIENNYTGAPALYEPMNLNVYPDNGGAPVPHNVSNGGYTFNGTPGGKVMWYGGTTYLPGIFNNTIHMKIGPNTVGNITLEAIYNGSIVSSFDHKFNVSQIPQFLNVTFQHSFNDIAFNGRYYFIISSDGFTGNVTFSGISVSQVKY